MNADIKYHFLKKVAIGAGIALLLFLLIYATPFLGVIILMVKSTIPPPGNQSEGAYYVERINASAYTYEMKDYIHLWEADTEIAGLLYRYSVTDRTKEDLTGKADIWDAAVYGDILYYEDKDGYWCLNLLTREQWQLADADVAAVEELLSPITYDETCEKIEEALDQLVDSYVDVSLNYLDRAEDDKIVGITQVPLNIRYRGSRLKQKGLRYDILFSYVPATGKCEILYQPKNNRTRIIGYQDGVIYLFKNNKIFRQFLDSDESEELVALPESSCYTFDWWEDYLLVFDHENSELVEVVEI